MQPSPPLWAAVPSKPGIYRMIDVRGRVLYIGRSSDLRSRVRSYWGDLRDRPHLRRMVRRIARVEFEVCESEHHAALLEREHLERRVPPFNRAVATESQVWIRLCLDGAAPSLAVVHELEVGNGVEHFGPYLGWAAASEAVRGLLRLYPISLAVTNPDGSTRELAAARGVKAGSLEQLAKCIRSVLDRDASAVDDCLRRLTELREQDAENLLFESAQEVHGQIDAIEWITQRQAPRAESSVNLGDLPA